MSSFIGIFFPGFVVTFLFYQNSKTIYFPEHVLIAASLLSKLRGRNFVIFFLDWKTCKTSYPIVKIINIKLGFIKTRSLPNTIIFVIYRSKIKESSGKYFIEIKFRGD